MAKAKAPLDLEPKPASTNLDLVTEQMAIHSELCAQRDTRFAVDWQTISSYVIPNVSDINTEKTENIAGWTQNLYDTTGTESAQVLAAGIGNWWTPQNQEWAGYGVPYELRSSTADDPNQADEADEGTQWTAKASETIMREVGRSNFYQIKGEADMSYAAFNTDLILLDESDSGEELFNFVHCKIKTYTIEENYKGIVDTVRREIKMTYRQIKQKFGKDSDQIPEEMERQAEESKGARQFIVLHCIFPRIDSDRMPKAKDGANKPIASVYISLEFKSVIRISGYDESPILCRRFAKWGTGAVWGYGPSYLALPNIRELNYVEQFLGATAEKLCDPPVLVPDNIDGDVDLRAGGQTITDSSNPNAKPEVWALPVEYKLGVDLQEKKRQAVRNCFFVDAFKLLNSQPLLDKKMTAFEISQRQAEQLQNVTPAFSRECKEFIIPCMKRMFGIAFRAGKLKDPPQSLVQADGKGGGALTMPEVVVTSRFNDALRALKNRGAEQLMAFLLPQVQFKPENADIIDWDKLNRGYARSAGVAADDLAASKSVTKLRNERMKIQQQQRQMELAQQASEAGKNLGQAPDFLQKSAQQAVSSAA